MARARTGEAISVRGRSASARKKLRRFIRQRAKEKKLDEWRRGRAVLGYIEGRRVVDLAVELDVTRGAVNRWLQWYEALGVEGLITATPPGAPPKLTADQREQLVALVEAGPLAAGYQSGVWTGPMIGDLIGRRFGVHYHKRTTHNRFFHTVQERDAALAATFAAFPTQPELLAGHVRRFLG